MRLLTCFALLILVLSLGASAVGRDEIKVYLVVGDWDTTYGEQIWRCNVDGTEPELVLDYTDFAPITAVALDDLTQRMVVDVGSLHSYTLDGTDMQYISQPSRSYSGQCMDSQSGYLSYLEGDNKTVTTELVSGGMVGSFDVRAASSRWHAHGLWSRCLTGVCSSRACLSRPLHTQRSRQTGARC